MIRDYQTGKVRPSAEGTHFAQPIRYGHGRIRYEALCGKPGTFRLDSNTVTTPARQPLTCAKCKVAMVRARLWEGMLP